VIFEQLRAKWIEMLGPERLGEMEEDLRSMVGAEGFRIDVAGWFGG
jgi:hypothetical protein